MVQLCSEQLKTKKKRKDARAHPSPKRHKGERQGTASHIVNPRRKGGERESESERERGRERERSMARVA